MKEKKNIESIKTSFDKAWEKSLVNPYQSKDDNSKSFDIKIEKKSSTESTKPLKVIKKVSYDEYFDKCSKVESEKITTINNSKLITDIDIEKATNLLNECVNQFVVRKLINLNKVQKRTIKGVVHYYNPIPTFQDILIKSSFGYIETNDLEELKELVLIELWECVKNNIQAFTFYYDKKNEKYSFKCTYEVHVQIIRVVNRYCMSLFRKDDKLKSYDMIVDTINNGDELKDITINSRKVIGYLTIEDSSYSEKSLKMFDWIYFKYPKYADELIEVIRYIMLGYNIQDSCKLANVKYNHITYLLNKVIRKDDEIRELFEIVATSNDKKKGLENKMLYLTKKDIKVNIPTMDDGIMVTDKVISSRLHKANKLTLRKASGKIKLANYSQYDIKNSDICASDIDSQNKAITGMDSFVDASLYDELAELIYNERKSHGNVNSYFSTKRYSDSEEKNSCRYEKVKSTLEYIRTDEKIFVYELFENGSKKLLHSIPIVKKL